LVEYIWRCFIAIQPDVSAFGFTKLTTICFFQQRTGKGKSLTLGFAANKLCTRNDITPLVTPTELQFYSLCSIQVKEVITLDQLVGKFGKRQAVLQALLY
jgi:hypothetical protein